MKASELVKNTAIIGIGKVSVQIIQFFLLPIYTSYLLPGEYGEYDYLTTIALFLVPMITLLMEEAMFRFLIPANNEKDKSVVLSSTVFFILSSSIICLTVLFILLSIFQYQYILFLMLYIIGMILYNLSTALARGNGNIKLYSFASFLSSLITIILNIVFIVVLNFGVKGIMLATSIAHILVSLFVFIVSGVLVKLSIKNIDKNVMKKMLKYALPLVPNSISWVIINFSDRVVIVNFLGASANGIYSIANKFPNLVNTVYGFFYTAWKEAAAKVIDTEDRDSFYQAIYKSLKRILFSICLGLIGFLPIVFPVLINNSYNDAFKYIPILIMGMYLSNISGFYGGIFSAYLDTKIMGKSTVISALVNLLITLAFINYIGVLAAVLSTFVSNVVVFLMRLQKIKKYIVFENDWFFNISSMLCAATVIFGYYFVGGNFIYKTILALLVVFYAIIANFNIIKLMYNTIKLGRINKS